MAKRVFARYFINRGNVTLWKGDPTEKVSKFRQVVINADHWNSTLATFQVLALEGTSEGIEDGGIGVDDDEIKVLSDEDLKGSAAMNERVRKLVADSEREGFRQVSFFEQAEYDQKIADSKKK